MKKTILSLALVAGSFATVSALTRTSVVNGAWNNPATWSPAGVPALSDDSIVINTSVTYSQNIQFGNTMFWVTANGTLIDLGTDTISFGGDYLVNDHYLSAALIDFSANNSVVNNGQMEVSEFIQGGLFINQTGAAVCASVQLVTSGNFTNDGDVSCGMWVNGAVVTGNGGQFCVSGNFVNSDQIGGSIDICDATPGGMGDINVGTIAGSVTSCQSGPCQSCILASVDEIINETQVKISPNPVTANALVECTACGLNGSHRFIVTDVSGRVVKSVTYTGSQFVFDRTGMNSGMYFYLLLTEDGASASGKFIVE